jgi:hypothetical protein
MCVTYMVTRSQVKQKIGREKATSERKTFLPVCLIEFQQERKKHLLGNQSKNLKRKVATTL